MIVPRGNLSPNLEELAQRCDGLSDSARRALAFKREHVVGQRLRRLAEDRLDVLVGPYVSLWRAFGPAPVQDARDDP
jgi:hypothetical protein